MYKWLGSPLYLPHHCTLLSYVSTARKRIHLYCFIFSLIWLLCASSALLICWSFQQNLPSFLLQSFCILTVGQNLHEKLLFLGRRDNKVSHHTKWDLSSSASIVWNGDPRERPLVLMGGLHHVLHWICHWTGKCVAIPLSLLSERRRLGSKKRVRLKSNLSYHSFVFVLSYHSYRPLSILKKLYRAWWTRISANITHRK